MGHGRDARRKVWNDWSERGRTMVPGVDLRQAPLARVVAACREETSKFLRRAAADDSFCLEVLRRAVCERHDAAWEAVLANYRGLVLSWVGQHPVAAARES